MGLLYLIDRTLTRLLQWVSKFLETKLRIKRGLQAIFCWFVAFGVFVSTISASDLDELKSITLTQLVIALPLYLLISVILLVVVFSMSLLTAAILKRLHIFLDREGALASDKLFSDGYYAWSAALVGMVCLGLSYVGINILIGWGLIFLTIFSPESFLERKRNDSKREPAGLTAAMRRLLERCKSWLPHPAPAPGA